MILSDLALGFNVYDPSTHYLVERGDYKIKRIKEAISSCEERIEDINTFILDFSKTKSELVIKLESLKKELSEITENSK